MPFGEEMLDPIDAAAQLCTGFNLVSTFAFYLAISRTFRKHFLDVILCRKA